MNEFPVVLVINCGSSSIKFSVLNASDCEVLMSGIADGINSENAFLSVNGGEPAPLAHHSYEGALKAIAFELEKRNLNDNVALIGHRINVPYVKGYFFYEAAGVEAERIALEEAERFADELADMLERSP